MVLAVLYTSAAILVSVHLYTTVGSATGDIGDNATTVSCWPSKLCLVCMPALSLLAYGAADFNTFCYSCIVVALVLTTLSVLWSGCSASAVIRYVSSCFDPLSAACFCLLVLTSGGHFTNSYLVEDATCCAFLLQSAVVVWCLDSLRRQHKLRFDGPRKKKQTSTALLSGDCLQIISLTLAILIFVRLGAYFRICREEQSNCVTSMFFKSPISNTSDSNLVKLGDWRFVLSVTSLIIYALLTRHFLRSSGNMNLVYSPATLCLKYALPIAAIMLIIHWSTTMTSLAGMNVVTSFQGFALIIYLLLLVTFICIYVWPVLIYTPMNSDKEQLKRALQGIRGSCSTPAAFMQLRLANDMLRSSKDKSPPVVYGLATAYSSPVIGLLYSVTILCMLLLQDGIAPSIAIHQAIVVLLVKLVTLTSSRRDFARDKNLLLILMLLGYHTFYSTAHQSTFNTIQWPMAYTGLEGFNVTLQLLPGCLLIFNTFCGHLATALAVAAVALAPYARSNHSPDGQTYSGEGELTVAQALYAPTQLTRIYVGFVTTYGIKLLMSMVAAAILRRHLMLWKVFAPRLIFDSCAFVIVLATSALVILYFKRFDHKIKQWITQLEKQYQE